jgi:hypothetical protein
MKQRGVAAIGVLGVLALAGAGAPAPAEDAGKSAPIKVAVFAFELQDSSPSAALLSKSTTGATVMEKVTDAARRELVQPRRRQSHRRRAG